MHFVLFYLLERDFRDLFEEKQNLQDLNACVCKMEHSPGPHMRAWGGLTGPCAWSVLSALHTRFVHSLMCTGRSDQPFTSSQTEVCSWREDR